jgi:phage terminase large subunit GpA-like protein
MINFADPTLIDDFEAFVSLVRPGFAPRPVVPSWEWVCSNGRTPEGQPFDGDTMPWAKGVCEAWDSSEVREIVLMWGTRLGKTMISMQLVAKAMATNPLPGLFGTANEKLATRTTRNKLYRVLAAIRETRRQLLPERLRSIREIRLTESTWPVIWSGSNTMLADWGACYGWANEVSKWDEKRSFEGIAKAGDTLAQFLERFKEYWHARKIIFECSPGLKGRCKIERKYLESNQCRYHVPCPHCKHYQVLKLGKGDGGGIVFDKLPDGHFDPELAQRTARYICEKCRKSIRDEQRPKMMRCGKWAPRGCTVDRKGKVCGKPERNCEIWGAQLSSLYSLQLRWGDIARKFVEVRHNPALLQVFINDWLSETWEPYRVKSEPEDVAGRLTTEEPVAVMPKWSTWLFSAVDVQGEYFKWAKVAAGPGERDSIIDRGICDTWEELFAQCINSPTKHADGAPDLLPCLTLIDSAHKTEEVYRKCREWSRSDRLVVPCKGANTDMGGEPYVKVTIGDGTKRGSKVQRRLALKFAGVVRIRVNSYYYEPIIDRHLHSRRPGESDSLSLPEELADDIDFIRELCNGAQSDEPSKMDPDRLIWVKRWESEANDFRDIYKYARCAIDVKFRGNWRVADKRQPSAAEFKQLPNRQPQLVGASESPRRGRRISLKRWRPQR